jgi:uncharacterized protein (TIGR00369 family)
MEHVYRSFARQAFMQTLGASLELVERGRVHIAVPFSEHLLQQHGYAHAGVVTSIADSASGYAALTLAPSGSEVLSVEFKISLLAPARGQRFLARAEVIHAGRRLSFCTAEVAAIDGADEQIIAMMLSTMRVRTA